MRRCASRPTRLLVAIRDFMRVRHIGPWKWIVPGSRRIRQRSVRTIAPSLQREVRYATMWQVSPNAVLWDYGEWKLGITRTW
jgi:hypothetical protein